MESIKKMNLSAIEDRLSVCEMQEIQAGSGWCNSSVGIFTGASCAAAMFAFYTPFVVPFGVGCAMGIAGGCRP